MAKGIKRPVMIRTESGRTSKSWRKSWVKAKSQEFVRVKFEGGEAGVPLASCSYVVVVDLSWPGHLLPWPDLASTAGLITPLLNQKKQVQRKVPALTLSPANPYSPLQSELISTLSLKSDHSGFSTCQPSVPHFWQIYK